MSNRTQERKNETKFLKDMRKENCRAKKIPDVGSKNPYDGFVVPPHDLYYPYEAKYQEDGINFSVLGWIKSAPHQLENLMLDYNRGHKAFLIVFWKRKGKRRIERRSVPVHKIHDDYIPLEFMVDIKCLRDLQNMFEE